MLSSELTTSDFDYDLPEELIASTPLEQRDHSRLLHLDRASGHISHHCFSDLPSFLKPDDLLVLNNTKVVPARYFSNCGKIELIRLEKITPTLWRSMVRPGKKMKVGRTVAVGTSIGTVTEIDPDGNRLIEWSQPVDENQHGHLALPHYMKREDQPSDRKRYQTVFAQKEGAIAAPTAGLHFTPELLSKLPHTFLTLHVGIGTFRPVKVENLDEHHMHSEHYHLSQESADKINHADRIVAIGTTVTRVLEHLARQTPTLSASSGETDIFIRPPYSFKKTGALLTNFHLPKSTLLMLVSALANRELILEAYREAIEKKYRFFSYGDCMLIT